MRTYLDWWINLLREKVSKEIGYRTYWYEGKEILTLYFRKFKIENFQTKLLYEQSEDEIWKEIYRLRNRVRVIKQPKDWRTERDIHHTKNEIEASNRRAVLPKIS